MKNKLPYACYSCGFVFFSTKADAQRKSAECWQHLCYKQHVLVFVQEGFSSGVNSSSPASGPEDWQMSFRSKMCLTTATATSEWRRLHVCFPLLCSWIFHLMFPNSSRSQRNMVWAEIKCFGFCGDHLIPVIHSLTYLPLTHMKSLNFIQWILCNGFHLHCPRPARLHDQLLLSCLKTAK